MKATVRYNMGKPSLIPKYNTADTVICEIEKANLFSTQLHKTLSHFGKLTDTILSKHVCSVH